MLDNNDKATLRETLTYGVTSLNDSEATLELASISRRVIEVHYARA
jgi:hypothetical protein